MINFEIGVILSFVIMFLLAGWAIGYAVGSPNFWEEFFKDLGC